MSGPSRIRRQVFLPALTIMLTLYASTPRAGAAEPKARVHPVAGKAVDSRALTHVIDQAIDQRLQAEGVQPSPRADDAEFLRRVYLDLTGNIPPADKTAGFLDDPSPNKRAKLVDELLASPDYGKHQADVWQKLLVPRTSDNRRLLQLTPKLTQTLEEEFNRNRPWDAMVRDLVTAAGAVDKNSKVVYFLANASADKMTDSVTRLFLGVQLQCAQCHNHPFTDWKQDEYWGMAAFFTKVRVRGNAQMMLRRGLTINVGENGPGRTPRLPDSARRLPPRFLQGAQPTLADSEPRRPTLARWMTRPDNPFFSRAMVNRTWAQLFGRGLVSPVDDMHEGNPSSHPELLAELSRQFAASGFDLKHLVRSICNSRAYQRTSKPQGNNRNAGPELLARMPIKVLTPEQLYDSLTRVLGRPDKPIERRGPGGRRLAINPRTVFVAAFQLDDGDDPTEYQEGIPQVLRRMNGPALNNGPALGRIIKDGKTPAAIIEGLYAATLSRRPTAAERNRLTAYVNDYNGPPRQAYSDILWALLNCSEFTLNH